MLNHSSNEPEGLDPEMFSEEDLQSVKKGSAARDEDMLAGLASCCMNTEDESDRLLHRQIAEGEQVLWQGRPLKLHSRMQGAGGILFGAFFLIFAFVWEMLALSALTMGGIGLIFPLFGLLFIGVGINNFFPNLFGGHRRQSTRYAITDRRVIEVCKGRVTSWPLNTIIGMEKRYFKDGTGDLILSNGQVETHMDANHHRRISPVTLCIMGVPDVDAAEAALNQNL